MFALSKMMSVQVMIRSLILEFLIKLLTERFQVAREKCNEDRRRRLFQFRSMKQQSPESIQTDGIKKAILWMTEFYSYVL